MRVYLYLVCRNAYSEETSDHIIAFGQYLYPKPGSDRGLFSIEETKLNRPELLEQRQKRLDELHRLIDLRRRAPDAVKPVMFRQTSEFFEGARE